MSFFMLILQSWKVLLYRLIFNISILGILFRTLCFLIPKMHWEKVHKIMSDQCTSHWFCVSIYVPVVVGPWKSPLEKKYNVCKNYDTKKIKKIKQIQRKINAYVNIKTDSFAGSHLETHMHEIAYDQLWILSNHTHAQLKKKNKKRSDELAKGNKKEQMLLLAAKIQPYAHTNVTYKYCLVHSHTELWWLCIFASPEQI